jgi:hypothetical protein
MIHMGDDFSRLSSWDKPVKKNPPANQTPSDEELEQPVKDKPCRP